MKKTRAKRPAGAHVILYRLLKAGNCHSVRAILLCKRTLDAPIHPGYWGLFGGTVKKNESPKQTVQRELKEELTANKIDFGKYKMKKVHYVDIVRENGKHIIRYFSASLEIDMDELSLRRWQGKVEGEGLGWFTAEEIHHLEVRPEDRAAINYFFEENGL